MSSYLMIQDPHHNHTSIFDGKTYVYPELIDAHVNLSQTNLRAVWDQLGLTLGEDLSWQGEAGVLLVACQRWLASPARILDSGERGVTTAVGGHGCISVDFGRRPNYFVETITAIRNATLTAIGLGGLSCGMQA